MSQELNSIIIISLTIIFISSAIGYFTNVIAIRLLFRPYENIRVLGFDVIGLIPKRRYEIAENIGKVIREELINVEELNKTILTAENKNLISDTLKQKIKVVLDEKMASIPFGLGAMIGSSIENVLDEELNKFVENEFEGIVVKLTENVDFGAISESKINEFDIKKIEEIILSVSKKELKSIEILGAVIGAVVGVFQAILFIFI